MTKTGTAATLAAITDALAHVHEQLDRVARSNGRIEAAQREMLRRIETVEAGQAAIAQVAAYAHAASLGNAAPLPAELADDPMLERFVLSQPADRPSMDRAMDQWRNVASGAGSAELAGLLANLYRPSPTDTPETRLRRYRYAAIAREELRGRGVRPPTSPPSTRARDTSPEAKRTRSAELACLWQAGGSTALYGEPELAGALDLFEAAERRGHGLLEERLSAELTNVHRRLGDRLAAGERPFATEGAWGDARSQPLEYEPGSPR